MAHGSSQQEHSDPITDTKGQKGEDLWLLSCVQEFKQSTQDVGTEPQEVGSLFAKSTFTPDSLTNNCQMPSTIMNVDLGRHIILM